MIGERWWDIVEAPAEVQEIDRGTGTFTVADSEGVYVVDLRTGLIAEEF